MSKRLKIIVLSILVMAMCYIGRSIVLQTNSHRSRISNTNEVVMTAKDAVIDSAKKTESLSGVTKLTLSMKVRQGGNGTRILLRSIFAILCKITRIPSCIVASLLVIVHSSCYGRASILNYLHKSDGKKKDCIVVTD